MDNELFHTLLDQLQPETLARMVVDVEQADEEWQHYPENAPSENEQKELIEQLDLLKQIGARRARAEGVDFEQLLTRLRAGHADWSAQRDRQESQNWLSDFD